MFEDIFGNLQKQQEEMQKKLATIEVDAEAGDGAVTVVATGDLRIENIKIDPAKVDVSDREQLEDLLVVAVNRALQAAQQKAAAETAKLMGDLLPPGGMDGFLKQ
jgi:nucleoid-associated protein EbfC